MENIFKEIKKHCNPDGTINFPITIPGQAVFSEFFGYLAPSSIVKDRQTIETESVLKNVIIKNPKIIKDSDFGTEMRLEASFIIPGSEPWSEYLFLSGLSGSLSGSVNVFSEFCEFDLIAALDRIAIKPTAQVNLLLRNSVIFGDMYSAARLELTLELEDISPVSFVTDLFKGKDYWWLKAGFSEGLGAFDIVNFFVKLFKLKSSGDLLLPPNSPINNFKLYEITLGMDYSDRDGLAMQYIRTYLATAEPWKLPLNFLTIDYLRMMWEMQWGCAENENAERPYMLTGQIAASLSLNLPHGMKLTLSGSALIPAMQIEAHLQLGHGDNTQTVGKLMGNAADSFPGSGAGGIYLAALDLWADCNQRELSLYAELNAGSVLNFNLGNLKITLARLYAGADFRQTGNSFLIGGEIDFGKIDENGFTLALQGRYIVPKSGDSYWSFRGNLARGVISIRSLIIQLLGIIPDGKSQFDIILSEFDIFYETLNKEFMLTAAFNAQWGKILGDIDAAAMGKVCVRSTNSKTSISVLLALEIKPFTASVQIDDLTNDEPAYYFRFAFREHALEAHYSKGILTAGLKNVSLGDIIAFLVEFVNPNRAVKFPPPWDFLNKINLDNFSFNYNFTEKSLGVSYRINLNIIGLFKLESIGLTYTKDSQVLFRLETGSANKAYEWDLLESNTPGMANTQNKFKLNYLAVAQHFYDKDGRLPKEKTIKDAVEYLSNTNTELAYSKDANWLFAADFTINDVFRARALLLDPHLYGIAITIEDNSKAPFDSFSGLFLELLYKKISRNIGMFRATLVLPQKFRRFSVGYATLTIGRMSIEIYTNGDFKIDMGFPHNRDFSQSFAIEFGIFSGSGGFYFGLMSGLTYPNLPAVSGGYYAPVIAIGIGLSIGIGRSFNIGIVSAGFSLQAVGILEGVIAFYNKDEKAVTAADSLLCANSESSVFRLKAVLGITGRVHVKVNLLVITLTASVELRAFAQITYETGKPVYIDLSLDLTLQASIKILFIKVSFKYNLSLRVQIKIDSSRHGMLTSALGNNLIRYISEEKTILKLDVMPYFSMQEVNGIHEHVLAFLPVMFYDDFEKLVKLLVEWVKASNESGDIDYQTINNFLTDNVEIILQTHETPNENTAEINGVIFAMPAPLELLANCETDKEIVHREFWNYNKVDNGYKDTLREYFKKFDLEESPAELNETIDSETPFAEIMFTDYFNMLLRHITKTVKQDGGTVNAEELAAMVSRFMLQGLRLPEINGQGDRALFGMNGQQVQFNPDCGGITVKTSCGQTGAVWLKGNSASKFTKEQIASQLPDLNFSWINRFTVKPMDSFMLSHKLCSVREQVQLDGKVLYCLNGSIAEFKEPVLRLNSEKSGEIINCDFGVLFPFEIQQTAHPDVFRVIGLEPADRAKLIPLFGSADYKLLFSPAPMEGIADTLRNLNGGENDCFVRQNLTRETRMFVQGSDSDEQNSVYVTDLKSAGFLKMLWQCSVVCGGYHLYLKPADSPRIPKNIFNEEGQAKLWLYAATDKKELVNCALSKNIEDCGKTAVLYDNNADEYIPALAPGCFGAEISMEIAKEDDGFSIMSYTISGNEKEIQSRPLVPVKNGSENHLHFAPVWALHILNNSQNPYNAKSFTFDFRLRDVLGNFANGSVSHTVMPGVSDFVVGVHEWVGNKVTWKAAAPGQIEVIISCPKPEKLAEDSGSLNNIKRALYQTGQKGYKVSVNGHAFKEDSVRTYLETLLEYLKDPQQNPEPQSISLRFSPDFGAAEPLEFLLVIERGADTNIERAKYAVTQIFPDIDAEKKENLLIFAKEFEDVFPNYKLSRTGAEPEKLTAMRIGDNGLSITVSPYERNGKKFPTYYAFRPLCNTPITRECKVIPWNGGKNEPILFSEIDIEIWARHILEDVDLLLSAGYAANMAVCPGLDELIKIKEQFAQEISRQLIPLEKNAPNAEDDQKKIVRAWVLDFLRVSLLEGYDLSSVAQYRAKLTSQDKLRLTLNAGGNGEVTAFAGKADTQSDILCVGYKFASRFQTGIMPDFTVKAEHLELNIEDIADGYQSSNWLQIIRPLDTSGLSFESDIKIPNPLRQIPEKSELLEHYCAAGEAYCKWNYILKIRTTAAEQDVLSVQVIFDNQIQFSSVTDDDDLFAALAQYETVRQSLLNEITENTAEFLPVFNNYAKKIAVNWNKPIAQMNIIGADTLNFEVSMKFKGETLELALSGYDKSIWNLEAKTLASEIKPGEAFELDVTVKNLMLYVRNRAVPRLHCIRNSKLLGDLTVDSRFIYNTEEVMLPALYAYTSRRDIICRSVRFFDKENVLLAQSFAAQALGFTESDCEADVIVRYQYGFNNSIIRLPVSMFTDISIKEFADNENIAKMIVSWHEEIKPIADNAALEFEFKINTGARALAVFIGVLVKFDAVR